MWVWRSSLWLRWENYGGTARDVPIKCRPHSPIWINKDGYPLNPLPVNMAILGKQSYRYIVNSNTQIKHLWHRAAPEDLALFVTNSPMLLLESAIWAECSDITAAAPFLIWHGRNTFAVIFLHSDTNKVLSFDDVRWWRTRPHRQRGIFM